MISAKGFLARRGPGLPPRLTDEQRKAVQEAVKAAFVHFRAVGNVQDASVDDRMLALAEKATLHVLTNYPTDRSCITCDYLHGVTCQEWKQEVPAEARETGCDKWFADGVPF